MTLSTHVWVTSSCDAEELFKYCQFLLYKVSGIPVIEQKTAHSEGIFANKIGQGLPAILEVKYGYFPETTFYEPEDAVSDSPVVPAHYCNIYLDTSYGFRHLNVLFGAGDLHSWLIYHIGQWLKARGCTFSWLCEFTLTINEGFTNIHELGQGYKLDLDFNLREDA